MTGLDCELFDCDTHCYETRDSFTRYLPKKSAVGRSRRCARRRQRGHPGGHRIATFNSEQGLGFDLAYRPGSLKEMLRQMASGNPDETYKPEPMRPEYLEREPRLQLMDARASSARRLPGRHGAVGRALRQPTPALYANLHSFNRWFDETWGFDYQGRIYATALLSLRDLDQAVAELDAMLGPGATVILLPPARPTGARRATRTSIRSGRG